MAGVGILASRQLSDGPFSDDAFSNGAFSNGPFSNGPFSDGAFSDGPFSDGQRRSATADSTAGIDEHAQQRAVVAVNQGLVAHGHKVVIE